MKYLISLLATVVLLSIFSCKKENIEADLTPTQNFIPLKIGNFWVYESVILDQNGNDSLTQRIDSVYINRDTVISGNTYFVFEGSYPLGGYIEPNIVSIQRDSAGYLVDHLGQVLFSYVNFTDTLNTSWVINGNDTISVAYSKTKSGNQLISTPAGEFNSLISETTFIFLSGQQPREEVAQTYYSNGVGKVLQPWHYNSLNWSKKTLHEIRLVRFHIEN